MRLRYRPIDGVEQTVELAGRLDGCTAADLGAELRCAVGGRGGHERPGEAEDGSDRGLWVSLDGVWHGPGTPLSSMAFWEGALIEVASAPGTAISGRSPRSVRSSGKPASPGQPTPPVSAGPSGRKPTSGSRADPQKQTPGEPPQGLVIAVTGGLGAGPCITAAPGRRSCVIGRSADCDVVLNDPAVSRQHARIVSYHNRRPVIDDLGSRNGVIVSGRRIGGPALVPAGASVRLGATRLEWRPAVRDTPGAVRAGLGAAAGRMPFNRPPRRHPHTAPAVLRAPAEPAPCSEPEPLSWFGLALPVAAGLALAMLWSPFMAVFAILGPLLTVGTWLERRRRLDKACQKECRDVAAEVERFAAALPTARARERRRRMSLSPDPAEIVRRACALSVRCWERRLDDPDAMRLGIGTADVPWTPPVDISGGQPGAETAVADGALDALAKAGMLDEVPVAVSLRAGEVLGIVGPAASARSVARSLVLQAAVLHGPADLAVAGLAPSLGTLPQRRGVAPGRLQADPWGWMRWLPHTADAGGGGAFVATDSAAMPAVVEAVQEAVASDDSQRMCLLVVDGAEPLAGRSAPGRALLALDSTAAIIMVSDTHDLPAACTTVVEVAHPAGSLRLVNPRSEMALAPVLAWGTTRRAAADAASRLARLEDPELSTVISDLPSGVALADLVDVELTPEAVSARWREARGAAGIAAPIGADASGPVAIDLVADGPHLLIGGTTGSGKSELLRTLVAGLALSADPDRLAFVLIDYKGGAAFDRCAEMPHVAGMVTDLDDRLAERALVCLESELRYREERLRDAGVEDLAAFQGLRGRRPGRRRSAAGPGRDAGGAEWDAPLPRLVVVVDEFATLASDLPEFLNSLVGIAQRGRSLGVHMVLATQRPAGVVTDDIRANTSCRIALRVTDRHDSNDVIGTPDAASIPRRRPGRALARFGPGELIAFQTALATGTASPSRSGLRVTAVKGAADGDARRQRQGTDPRPRPYGKAGGCERSRDAASEACPGERAAEPSRGRRDAAPGVHPGAGGAGGSDTKGDPSDLDRVVEAVRGAHAMGGGRPPRSPWPAPLPDEVTQEELLRLSGPGRRAAWLVDDPGGQRQSADAWRPDDGHLIVIGSPGSGASTTLAVVAMDLCRERRPGELHIYGIDFDNGLLTVLDGLPHTGTVVRRSDAERRIRLLRFLHDEIAARRASDVEDSGFSDSTRGESSGMPPRGLRADDVDRGTPEPVDRPWPGIVLLVDDLAGIARAHDPVSEPEVHRRLARIWSNGPAVGVTLAVSIGRAADLPSELAASAGVVLIHATADADGGFRFGLLRADTSAFSPGRALRAQDGKEVQVARPADGDFQAAVATIASAATDGDAERVGSPAVEAGARGSRPVSIGVLPAMLPASALPVGGTSRERLIDLRFAMSDLTLGPFGFELHNGEHALVLGPARSGRTAALAAIGEAGRRSAGTEVLVVSDSADSDLAARLGVAPVPVAALSGNASDGVCLPGISGGSPDADARRIGQHGSRDRGTPGRPPDAGRGHGSDGSRAVSRRLLLVDDADCVHDGASGVLRRIARERTGRDHLVAAVAPDRLRSAYSHWLTELRSCRTGVLLRPGPLDGDLLGVTLPPSRRTPPRPGRGLVAANGTAVLCQMAFVDIGACGRGSSSSPSSGAVVMG